METNNEIKEETRRTIAPWIKEEWMTISKIEFWERAGAIYADAVITTYDGTEGRIGLGWLLRENNRGWTLRQISLTGEPTELFFSRQVWEEV